MKNYKALTKEFCQIAMQLRSNTALKVEGERTGQEKKRILSLVRLHEGLHVRELAYLLGYPEQGLKDLIEALEKDCLLELYTVKEGKAVKLTEKGQLYLQDDGAINEKGNPFACLTEEEQVVLDTLLKKISKSLGEEKDEEHCKRHRHMHGIHNHFGHRGIHRIFQGMEQFGFEGVGFCADERERVIEERE